ncbi:hypothetical protein [Brachybacterium sp.]|uniref:hypothetical protein n=1 Tax=Brachybacterium sp. TaxID=1891286 RepID=UPI002ED3A0C2
MSQSNYPYGDGGSQGHPGSGYPGQQPAPQGDGEQLPAPSPDGAVPSSPASGASFGSAAPPTSPTPAASAPSAAPGPWSGSAPSAPAPPSAAQAGAVLKKVGIGNPLPTFIVGALAYVVALGASLVVIVSAVLAVLTFDTGDLTGGTDPIGGAGSSSGGDGGFQMIVGLIGIPFQLVSLASFGSYDLDLSMGFLGSVTMSSRGLPLLITVAMVATGFLGARLVQRRLGSGRWGSNGALGALLWTGISGLAVAIFAVIVTRLTAFAYEDASVGMSFSMHSAGADMFFGTWVLIGLPMLLGHLAGMEKPSWWPLVADLAAAPRLALVHALAFAIPVGILTMVGGAIGLLLDGDGQMVIPLLLSLPIWGLTGLAMLPGLGMLTVPLHMNSQGAEDLGIQRANEFLWFFDLPWYAWIPMVLIALLIPLLVAVLWHRDREIVSGSIPALVASWAALPLAYFAGSLVLIALVWTRTHVDMGLMGDIAVSMSLAAWMPLVAFFLGLVIEAIARFGAPFVDRFVPGVLVNWFRRSARARRAEQAASSEQVQGAEAASPSQAPEMPVGTGAPYGHGSPYGQGSPYGSDR